MFHFIQLFGACKEYNFCLILIWIICRLCMCFQLCLEVSVSTRWLQNEKGIFLFQHMLILSIFGISAAHIIPLTQAQKICIKIGTQKCFNNFTNSPPSQFPQSCPHLKLIKAQETGFLCDLLGNWKDGVIHCHFTNPSLWQALFQFVDP